MNVSMDVVNGWFLCTSYITRFSHELAMLDVMEVHTYDVICNGQTKA